MNSTTYSKEFLKKILDEMEAGLDEFAGMETDDETEAYITGKYNAIWDFRRKLQLP